MAGKSTKALFRCLSGCTTYPLSATRYDCERCGELLEVIHDDSVVEARSGAKWRELFQSRSGLSPGIDGSGVWRYREWVLPDIAESHIVTLGEGSTPLTHALGLSDALGVELLVKQCGQSLSGSFKDLGMTVLVSQVAQLRADGVDIPAVACASTGDTSAALGAYGAAAGLRCLVFLPRGKITAAQLVQPLSHGARVIAIDTDFDGCMRHVQKICAEEGVYLANSKNSLRIEGQKTVAFEIIHGLGFSVPDWIAIPGGNLGNVSALYKGLLMLQRAGLIDRLPRLLCAQAERANPLYKAFQADFQALVPVQAEATQANAIRIGNPVSYPKAVAALRATNGVVASVSEQELSEVSALADQSGLFVCPHTAVALGAVKQHLRNGAISRGDRVVVVATAHGLKFTEFKRAVVDNSVDGASLIAGAQAPIDVADDYDAVRRAALD